MRRSVVGLIVLLALILVLSATARAADRDGDGISDHTKRRSAQSRPARRAASRDRRRPGIGGQSGQAELRRHQGRADRRVRPRGRGSLPLALDGRRARPLEDTVFHLYVDADADESTGRKSSPGAPNHGTDYMATVAGGSPRITAYAADGTSTSGPPRRASSREHVFALVRYRPRP